MKNILDKIKIDFSTYILIMLGLFAGYIKNIFIILVIILIHEFGHVFFFYLFNIDIEKIVIYPFGGVCKVNKKIHERIYKDILVSLGGVIFQLLLIIVVCFLYKFDFIVNSTYKMFVFYNSSIILFNMIPLVPLDGSKLLFSIFTKYFSYKNSYIMMIMIGTLFFIFFVIYNMYLKINDITICVFLLCSLISFIKDYKLVMRKFYLERIIYDNYYDGIISNMYDIEHMRIDKYYYYKLGKKYINEKSYLMKKSIGVFDNS